MSYTRRLKLAAIPILLAGVFLGHYDWSKDSSPGVVATRASLFEHDSPPSHQFFSSIVAGGGPALDRPSAVAIDRMGNIYVSSTKTSFFSCTSDERVVKISTDGLLSVVAGEGARGYTGDEGPATEAMISGTIGLTVDNSGNLYLSTENGVRKVDGITGIISTVRGIRAGQEVILAGLGLAVDHRDNLYVANGTVEKRDPFTHEISVVAGGGSGRDGVLATEAALEASGVALDRDGDLYISELFGRRCPVFR